MTDLLDQLRAANPVDRDALEVPAARAPRGTPRRARRPRARVLLVAAGLAVAALVVVALVPGRRGAPDLAARAFAATSGPGVVHWRTEMVARTGVRTGGAYRTEGWSGDGVTHLVVWAVADGRTRLVSDGRTADGRTTTYLAGEDDYLRTPAVPPAGIDPNRFSDDPLATFRRAYRAHRLRRIGPHRLRIDLPGRGDDVPGGIVAYYDLDPRTALPRRFVMESTPRIAGRAHPETSVTTFTTYERLPLDAASRAHLRLLPHPGAGPKDTSPAAHFAVLRAGARPDAVALARLTQAGRFGAGRFALRPALARAVAPGRYLVPGHGYVCLFTATPTNLGGTCQAIDRAIARGIRLGAPRHSVDLVVPDGVSAVAVRVPGRGWVRHAVHDNLVRLPARSYVWQLVRR